MSPLHYRCRRCNLHLLLCMVLGHLPNLQLSRLLGCHKVPQLPARIRRATLVPSFHKSNSIITVRHRAWQLLARCDTPSIQILAPSTPIIEVPKFGLSLLPQFLTHGPLLNSQFANALSQNVGVELAFLLM